MRNAQPFVSVGTRLALGIAFLVALVSLISGAVLAQWQWASLLEAKTGTVRALIALLGEVVETRVLAGDGQGVQQAVSTFAQTPGVLYVRVDRLPAGEPDSKLAEYRHPSFLAPVRRAGRGADEVSEFGAGLLVTGAVGVPAGTPVAAIAAVFSLEAERVAREGLIRQLLWGSLGAGVVLTLVLLLLTRAWVTRPVRLLMEAAQRVEIGDRIESGIQSHDELGALAESFDSMARAIAQREQALAVRNRELKLVMDNVPAAIAMLDRDLRYVACSQRWLGDHHLTERILGEGQAEASPQLWKLWQESQQRALHGHVERCEEARLDLGEGNVRWVRWEAQPWYERPHHVGGIVMVTEDITERHRLGELIRAKSTEAERALDELRFRKFALDEHAVVSEVDSNGLIVWANPRFCDVAGRELSALQGTPIRQLLVFAEGGAQWSEVLEALARCNVWHGELCARTREGAKCWLATTLAATHDSAGRVDRYVGIHTDITAQKNTQATLELRAEQLEKAMDRAEAADRAKSDFLATMSHEIRTPMNGVIGFAHLLLQTRLDDEQRSFALTIQNSGEDLLTIINDILDFSKIEAGAFRIEPASFDLRESLAEAIELYAERAHEKGLFLGLDLADDVPKRVFADAARIRQVLLNLVGNAVKFTEQGHVLTRVTREGNHLRFEVEDTGPGVDPEARSRLFARLAQGDSSTTRRHGGTGLGLAISHRLTELMGGSIGIKSSAAHGSCFYFTVELQVLEEHAVVLNPTVARLQVMVFDANQASRDLLTRQLHRLGVSVDAVATEDALMAALIGDRECDVLVLAGTTGADLTSLVLALRADARFEALGLVRTFSTARGHERVEGTLFDAAFGIPVTRGGPVEEALLAAAAAGAARRDQLPPPTRAAPQATIEITPVGSELIGVQVLLVEDNPVNQRLATRLLERLGCQVALAANGREAVTLAVTNRFDVALMDCHMPEMDGFEATQAIRSSEQARRMPIIALTADAMKGDRERCLSVGMDDYLAKPLRERHLYEALVRWCPSGATRTLPFAQPAE